MRSLQQQCSECLSVLPTPYLLSIHVSEQHDSFFASQATQRMNVFRCLVEGCGSTFSSAAQRRQHLLDLHQIPLESCFDRCAKLLLTHVYSSTGFPSAALVQQGHWYLVRIDNADGISNSTVVLLAEYTSQCTKVSYDQTAMLLRTSQVNQGQGPPVKSLQLHLR